MYRAHKGFTRNVQSIFGCRGNCNLHIRPLFIHVTPPIEAAESHFSIQSSGCILVDEVPSLNEDGQSRSRRSRTDGRLKDGMSPQLPRVTNDAHVQQQLNQRLQVKLAGEGQRVKPFWLDLLCQLDLYRYEQVP